MNQPDAGGGEILRNYNGDSAPNITSGSITATGSSLLVGNANTIGNTPSVGNPEM